MLHSEDFESRHIGGMRPLVFLDLEDRAGDRRAIVRQLLEPFADGINLRPRERPDRGLATLAFGAAIVMRACPGRGASMGSAIAAARKALAAQAAAGNDPRRTAAMNRVRSEAVSEGHRRNRNWEREHPGQRDEACFKREIVPKLDALSL